MEILEEIWREYRADNIGPGSIVIDIGSSEGYFTNWAKSFGATVESYDARYGAAVGSIDGYCSIEGNDVCAYIIPGVGDIPMISLRSILSKHDHIDFLKCDIEGSEYLIFDDSCDLSKVDKIAIEFHMWTTPDIPIEGLAIRDFPMPEDALNKLLAILRRTHSIEIVGDPAAGGYLHGRLYEPV